MDIGANYMDLAIELAKRGLGWVNPNPMVGAVIVKDGAIIGQGYHEKYGGFHAERNALKDCRENPSGATMYVTLEPCCHYGKTPPCSQAIIDAGISKVIIATLDPNPLVAGKGVAQLREAGIQVEVGLLEREVKNLLKEFLYYIKNKEPYIILKYAMTLDGKLASRTGDSKWITGPLAREAVHQSRHQYSGIMVGVNTVLADNPSLTSRLEVPTQNPIRIICDSHLRTPMASGIVQTAKKVKTILATCSQDGDKIRSYQAKGLEIVQVPENHQGQVDLSILIPTLGQMGINSIYVEGGSQLHWSLIDGGWVNEIHTYIGNKIIGGRQALSPVGGQGFATMDQSITTRILSIEEFEEDILIKSEVIACSQES